MLSEPMVIFTGCIPSQNAPSASTKAYRKGLASKAPSYQSKLDFRFACHLNPKTAFVLLFSRLKYPSCRLVAPASSCSGTYLISVPKEPFNSTGAATAAPTKAKVNNKATIIFFILISPIKFQNARLSLSNK